MATYMNLFRSMVAVEITVAVRSALQCYQDVNTTVTCDSGCCGQSSAQYCCTGSLRMDTLILVVVVVVTVMCIAAAATVCCVCTRRFSGKRELKRGHARDTNIVILYAGEIQQMIPLVKPDSQRPSLAVQPFDMCDLPTPLQPPLRSENSKTLTNPGALSNQKGLDSSRANISQKKIAWVSEVSLCADQSKSGDKTLTSKTLSGDSRRTLTDAQENRAVPVDGNEAESLQRAVKPAWTQPCPGDQSVNAISFIDKKRKKNRVKVKFDDRGRT